MSSADGLRALLGARPCACGATCTCGACGECCAGLMAGSGVAGRGLASGAGCRAYAAWPRAPAAGPLSPLILVLAESPLEADGGGRFGASLYPHTPQNRAVGSSGELHDGHVISPNFRRTFKT